MPPAGHSSLHGVSGIGASSAAGAASTSAPGTMMTRDVASPGGVGVSGASSSSSSANAFPAPPAPSTQTKGAKGKGRAPPPPAAADMLLQPPGTTAQGLANGSSSTPLFDAEQVYAGELPDVRPHLVPLSFVVERVLAHAYGELSNLIETLPSFNDTARKRATVDYVLQTRRQFLKLLVLVRWSAESHTIEKCMKIIGFLQGENAVFEHAVSRLVESKDMLAHARVRNYDLTTALDVLDTGSYARLPPEIRERFERALPFDNVQTISLLRQVNNVLRARLALFEPLPKRLRECPSSTEDDDAPTTLRRPWTIDDGRATFSIPSLWRASLTFGGDSDDPIAQWFLLDFKFLFRVLDPIAVSRGQPAGWASAPAGPVKDQVIEIANSELARRADDASEDDEGEGKGSAPTRAPFFRLYTLMQRLALSYQLEALSAQAFRLADKWRGNVRAAVAQDRRSLTIEYWIDRMRPKQQQGQQKPPPPPPPPTVRISFDDADGRGAGDSLKIDWFAAELPEEVRSHPGSPLFVVVDGEKEEGAEPRLSIEPVLLNVVAMHATHAMLQIYEALTADSSPLDINDVELVMPAADGDDDDTDDPAKVPFVRYRLKPREYLEAHINAYSGRVDLRHEPPTSLAATREARLRNAAAGINDHRGHAGEMFVRLRAWAVMDDVEARAASLGLVSSRRIAIRNHDLARFGGMCLFIELGELASHYLVLVLTEQGFRFALIGVRVEFDLAQTWLEIEDMGWLTTRKSNELPFELGIEELRDQYEYCVRRIAFFKIEQALQVRKIPCQTVKPSASPQSGLSSTAPYLVVRSAHLLQSAASIAFPNIAIHLRRSDASQGITDASLRATVSVRFKDLSAVREQDQALIPRNIQFDFATGVMTFTSSKFDSLIPTFLEAFARVVRAIVLREHDRRRTQL